MDVSFDTAALLVGDRELHGFIPTAELEVKGLGMRYRRPGIGAPLAASVRPVDPAKPEAGLLAPRVKVPVTALLRIPQARAALVQSRPLTAALELHLLWEAESVSIAGRPVPLESDPSAALAYTFTGIPIVELEMLGLLGRVPAVFATRPPLISGTPYKPGLIPVVFVHGTESSVVRWAEMYNRLVADPDLRSRYQFWFFQYDSGNPIALSSLRLRDALKAALAHIDPDGADAALRNMLLIGHSQGGLLVKMQVIDTGDRLWNAVSRKPLAELKLSPETHDLLQRGLFVKPVPQVTRVVFICTPQRGSFVAGRTLIANLVRRLMDLPNTVTGLTADLARNADASVSPFMPTAVDNMSPRSPFIHGLQDIPVVASVKVHSIIAVEGDGPVQEGDDGVVKYSSAHIEPVESELVVKSSHSTQGNPHTIEEVRRILRQHAGLP
jgi:pimeloyl-ACP methyl ester carboxylesterase